MFVCPTASDPQHRQCPYSGRYAVTNYLGGDIVCSTHPNNNIVIPKDIDNNDINTLVRTHPKASPRRTSAAGSKSLDVGCGMEHTMEFHSHCEADSITGRLSLGKHFKNWLLVSERCRGSETRSLSAAYSCHGSWSDNGTSFTIAVPLSMPLPGWGVGAGSGPAATAALRRDADPAVRRLCFVYRELVADDASGAVLNEALRQPSIVIQSRVGEECHRHHLHDLQERSQAQTMEGVVPHDVPPVEAEAVFWAFDLTPNGE